MIKIRLLLELLRRSWVVAPLSSAVITVVIIAQSASAALTAAIQRHLVDQVGRPAMLTAVVAVGVGLAVAFAAGAAGNRIQGNLRGVIAEKLDIDLSGNVLRWATQTPRIDQYDRPDFLDRLHLVRTSTSKLAGISWNLVNTVCVVLGLAASLVLLARINPWLMIMAVLAVPPFLLNGRSGRYLRQARDRTAAWERQEATLHGYASQPEQAKEVRVNRSQPIIDDHCATLWDRTRRTIRAAHLKSALHGYAGWLIFAVGYLGAVALTILLVTQRQASLGDLVLVISLGQQLRWQVISVVYGISEVADGGHAAGHYDWLRRQYRQARRADEEPVPPPPRLDRGISVDGLSFRYPGQDHPAVDGVSVELEAGQVVALLGENGAGKTTLAKLLLGQYAPDAGGIRLDGVDLARVDPAVWARRCSGLLQDFGKLQGPVREAVGAGALRPLSRADLDRAVDEAHARSIVDGLPRGLDTSLGLAFGTRDLSHGQWQRLALARGLTRPEPLLLILDEPTSALDPEVEHRLFDAFFSSARRAAAEHGSIALIISHRLSTTQDADLILVMDRGRIVESGDHATLIDQGGRYSELYRLQTRAYR
ncbi:ABC transporter ATP-binding protein [Microlunatus sp. GCM10028923]|uniref:ABC transporter ATP-binding protein n=1 Tax=Microlunatus sp. GCM10028923 TaxID=3273400 RepID=UPI003613217D